MAARTVLSLTNNKAGMLASQLRSDNRGSTAGMATTQPVGNGEIASSASKGRGAWCEPGVYTQDEVVGTWPNRFKHTFLLFCNPKP
jgi:hypothetical protein